MELNSTCKLTSSKEEEILRKSLKDKQLLEELEKSPRLTNFNEELEDHIPKHDESNVNNVQTKL